jgi:hypothetical protein
MRDHYETAINDPGICRALQGGPDEGDAPAIADIPDSLAG